MKLFDVIDVLLFSIFTYIMLNKKLLNAPTQRTNRKCCAVDRKMYKLEWLHYVANWKNAKSIL